MLSTSLLNGAIICTECYTITVLPAEKKISTVLAFLYDNDICVLHAVHASINQYFKNIEKFHPHKQNKN